MFAPFLAPLSAATALWLLHLARYQSLICVRVEQGDDQSRLFLLSENGQAAMLDVFLEQKGPTFNVNMMNSEGETALHVAARHGKIQSCKILLRRGAELIPDAYAKTPYDVAVNNGHTYCASLLRAKFDGNMANLSMRDSTGSGGLMATQSSVSSNNYAGNSIHGSAAAPQFGGDATTAAAFGVHSQQNQPSPRREPPPQESTDQAYNVSTPRENQGGRVLAEIRAMYNYSSADELPFPPDQRPEFTLVKGESLELMHMREDGWCIVRRPNSRQEGFAPGNTSQLLLCKHIHAQTVRHTLTITRLRVYPVRFAVQVFDVHPHLLSFFHRPSHSSPATRDRRQLHDSQRQGLARETIFNGW